MVPRRDRADDHRREGADTIAALFAEPVQGAGGVIVPPPGHLRALRELCRSHDILFVADEVITGFGRLGDWFASTLWGLEPDLMTMAKGITSGYVPLGATHGERRDRRRRSSAAATWRTASPTAAIRWRPPPASPTSRSSSARS